MLFFLIKIKISNWSQFDFIKKHFFNGISIYKKFSDTNQFNFFTFGQKIGPHTFIFDVCVWTKIFPKFKMSQIFLFFFLEN
jgi:hypothetical protein